MKTKLLLLLFVLQIIQSCSFRNPFILDAPYCYKATAIINDEESSQIHEYETRRVFFTQRSISSQAAPQFFLKTIKSKDIVAFCFQPYLGLPFQRDHYVFPCYWICYDSVIEDSKPYYYNNEFKKLFDADEDKEGYVLYSDVPHFPSETNKIGCHNPIRGGKILSGWMSFTKHTGIGI